MIFSHLQLRSPRRALHLFLHSLANPHPLSTPHTAQGILWLFLRYDHLDLVIEAIEAMHKLGYRVSVGISVKLLASILKECPGEIEKDSMRILLEWVEKGVKDDSGASKMDVGLVRSIMEILKRAGRIDALRDLFRAYEESLEDGELVPAELWSILVTAFGQDGDLMLAYEVFEHWRDSFRTKHPAPHVLPEGPYLALIRLHSLFPPDQARRFDPALSIISLLSSDSIPFSPNVLSTLLGFELSRFRFRSFWSLWAKFDELQWERNGSTWRHAVKALLWGSVQNRREKSSWTSPVPALLDVEVRSRPPPTSRELLVQVLRVNQKETSRRPSLVLPDPTLTTPLLNSFLRLYIAQKDFAMANFVLECYKVHKKDPDAETHSAVVLGVTELWATGALDSDSEDAEWDNRRLGLEGGRRIRRMVSENDKLAFMTSILEERRRDSSSAYGNREEAGEDVLEPTTPPPAEWMLKRELRDFDYLEKVLMRCEGVGSEEAWGEKMKEVREEVLEDLKRRDMKKPSKRRRFY